MYLQTDGCDPLNWLDPALSSRKLLISVDVEQDEDNRRYCLSTSTALGEPTTTGCPLISEYPCSCWLSRGIEKGWGCCSWMSMVRSVCDGGRSL